MKFKNGDHVIKNTGDYTFIGTVVATFQKTSGLDRYVVENKEGILHIFSETNLSQYPILTRKGYVKHTKPCPHPKADISSTGSKSQASQPSCPDTKSPVG